MSQHSRLICLFSLLVCSTCVAEINVLFAPSSEIPVAIEKALDAAEQRIDLAIYSFSDRRLQTRLKAAAARGIQVRVILHNARKQGKLASSLEAAKIDVRYTMPIMHHKFVIIDGPRSGEDDPSNTTLLTGSCNWARSAYSRFDEDVLHFTNEPKFAVAFQSEFNFLWQHSREFGDSIHGGQVAQFASNDAEVLFTSANMKPAVYRGEPTFRSVAKLEEGVCGRELVRSIDAAKATIKIATTHFRREDLYKALLRAMDDGVSVQLLLDQQEFHPPDTTISNARFDEALAAAGADVRYKVYSRSWDYRTALQMHCKYMIVDDSIVHTGSLNWSENSELKTIENLITLKDQKLVDQYCTRFQLKWGYGGNKVDMLIAKVKASKGKAPFSFKPVTLTGKQLKKLLAVYANGAGKTMQDAEIRRTPEISWCRQSQHKGEDPV